MWVAKQVPPAPPIGVSYFAEETVLACALGSLGVLILDETPGVYDLRFKGLLDVCTLPVCTSSAVDVSAVAFTKQASRKGRVYSAGKTGVYYVDTPIITSPSLYVYTGALLHTESEAVEAIELSSGNVLLVCFHDSMVLVYDVTGDHPVKASEIGDTADGGCTGILYDPSRQIIFVKQHTTTQVYDISNPTSATQTASFGHVSVYKSLYYDSTKQVMYNTELGVGLVVWDVKDVNNVVRISTCCYINGQELETGFYTPSRGIYFVMRGAEVIAIDLLDDTNPQLGGSSTKDISATTSAIIYSNGDALLVLQREVVAWNIAPPPTPEPRTALPTTTPTPPSPTSVPSPSPPLPLPPVTTVPIPSATVRETMQPTEVPRREVTFPPGKGVALATEVPGGGSGEEGEELTPAEKRFEERTDTAKFLGQMTAVAGVGVGGGGPAALRLIASMQRCHVGAVDQINTSLHPTQWAPFASAAAGMVLGNLLITAGFGLFCFLLVQIARHGGTKLYPKAFEGLDTQGWLRFPSAPLAIFQYCYQGTTLGSMILIGTIPSVPLFIIGVTAFGVCIVVPVSVFCKIKSDAKKKATYVHDPSTGKWLAFMIGSGEWVSLKKTNHWINRYASVVRTYRPEVAWYSFIEFLACLALAAVLAITPDDSIGCGHVKMASCAIFLILLVIEGYVLPHARPRDSAFGVVYQGSQLSAMAFMAYGYYENNRDSWTFDVASWLLSACAALLVFKTTLDIASELFIIIQGRRRRLQESMFGSDECPVMTPEADVFEMAATFAVEREEAHAPNIEDDDDEDSGAMLVSLGESTPPPWMTPLLSAEAEMIKMKEEGGGGLGGGGIGVSVSVSENTVPLAPMRRDELLRTVPSDPMIRLNQCMTQCESTTSSQFNLHLNGRSLLC